MLSAQSLLKEVQRAPSYRVAYHDTTLANGLRVLTVESHFAPVVAGELFVNFGSRYDPAARGGLAHLLEHTVGGPGAGDYRRRAGVSYGASTGDEWTDYIVRVPSANMDAALFMLAGLMREYPLTEEQLDSERGVVIAESDQTASNRPYGRSLIVLRELYWEDTVYAPTRFVESTNATTLEELRRAHDAYYAPNSSILVLVGDFDRPAALAAVHTHLGTLPRKAIRPPTPVRMLPLSQTRERRTEIRDALAPAPRIDVAFRTIPDTHSDLPGVAVLTALLGRNAPGRLHARLVSQRSLFSAVEASLIDWRAPPAPAPLTISATLRPGGDPVVAEQALFTELARFTTELVTQAELEQAKTALLELFMRDTRGGGARDLAFNLGYFATRNRPDLINGWLSELDAVTPEAVRTVAARYLRESHRTIVVTLPGPRGRGGRQ